MPQANSLTAAMYAKAAPYWQASFAHPFITSISDGTLPMATFRYYLKQDAYYLQHFAELHLRIAEKISDISMQAFLRAGSEGLNDGEAQIRATFFEQLGVTAQEMAETPVAPTTYQYVTHMHYALSEEGAACALAALLPCYWLYNDLGKRLVRERSPVALYQQFLETYDSEAFTATTQRMIAIVDAFAQPASAEGREKMLQAFLRSSYYESRFWDMAYGEEKW